LTKNVGIKLPEYFGTMEGAGPSPTESQKESSAEITDDGPAEVTAEPESHDMD
jgi:hypothetical protein